MATKKALRQARAHLYRLMSKLQTDEAGQSALEKIIFLFIMVVLIVAVAAFVPGVWTKVKDTINSLMGTTF